eukprot:PhM_4_TR1709/c0_g1_i1/m.34431
MPPPRPLEAVLRKRPANSPMRKMVSDDLNRLQFLSTVLPQRAVTTLVSEKDTAVRTVHCSHNFLGFSKPTLTGANKSLSGPTVVQYLQQARVDEAETLGEAEICHVLYMVPIIYSGVHVAVLRKDLLERLRTSWNSVELLLRVLIKRKHDVGAAETFETDSHGEMRVHVTQHGVVNLATAAVPVEALTVSVHPRAGKIPSVHTILKERGFGEVVTFPRMMVHAAGFHVPAEVLGTDSPAVIATPTDPVLAFMSEDRRRM